jgi:hypothetical protein
MYPHAWKNVSIPENKNMTQRDLFDGLTPRRTDSAWAKRPQIVVGVNSRAVSILPSEFDGIIAHRADFLKLRFWYRYKSPLRSVALAHGTWTVTAQILIFVLPDVAIIPSDPHRAAGLHVIDLSGIRSAHSCLQFD